MSLNASNEEWYKALPKSSLTPPSIVFKIVWPILYASMAVSLGFFLSSGGWKSKTGLAFFLLQLGLNLMWSPVFFRWRKPKWGLLLIILTWILLLGTVILFYQQDRKAGLILTPYLLWLSFAAYLNFYIVHHMSSV